MGNRINCPNFQYTQQSDGFWTSNILTDPFSATLTTGEILVLYEEYIKQLETRMNDILKREKDNFTKIVNDNLKV